jgi:hypothetical protein
MTWQRFATDAPEMAELGKQLLEQSGVAVVGTIRADGSPRISSIEPLILEQLYLSMMWRSRKALDLLRDPRLVLRNAICTSTGDEAEIILRGRAVDIHDAEARERYRDAVAMQIAWTVPRFHLFAVDIESAALIRYGRGEQAVKLWPQDVEFRRLYG